MAEQLKKETPPIEASGADEESFILYDNISNEHTWYARTNVIYSKFIKEEEEKAKSASPVAEAH